MKYLYEPNISLSLSEQQFRKLFPKVDPKSDEAEERVKEFAQKIIEEYLTGRLFTEEQVRARESEAYSSAVDSYVPNDIRFMHGPSGC